MIELSLELRPRNEDPRPTVARLILSPKPEVWLRELTAWSIDLVTLRLVPLRVDARSPDCHALFVYGDNLDDTIATGIAAPVISYSNVGANCFIPSDCDLFPAVDSGQLAELLPPYEVHIWRPTAGVVSVAPGDTYDITDLIHPPATTSMRWDRAVPGIALPTRLPPLGPAEPPTIDDIIADGRDDIGRDATSPSDLAGLPRSPNEAKPGIGQAVGRAALYGAAATAAGVTKAMSKIGNALASMTPSQSGGGSQTGHGSQAGQGASSSGAAGGGFSGPSWIERLAEYASGRMQQISRSLQARRNKEIERLMHMLDTDPDKGLRFAIPFGGTPGRGTARPGGSLVEHGTNFRMPGVGGGGAADGWDIDFQQQVALREKYRNLANRELALGRYRRAAYIFAELLDDFSAAASALRSGRHFREAAVLFRDRLRRPAEAAECLEEGGLWTEAIEQYESIRRFEKVGDLYRKIDQEEDATTAYQQAIDQRRRENDFLDAARICEEKQRDVDQALAVLVEGWPHTTQAEKCLRGRFALLNRLGRVAEAHVIMQQLADGSQTSWALTTHDLATAAHVLSDLANDPTMQTDKAIAVESTTRIVANALPNATVDVSRRLVDAVSSLAREDRMLRRDGQRFLEQRSKATSPRPEASINPRRRRRKHQPVEVEAEWSLEKQHRWKAAAICNDTLIAVGHVTYSGVPKSNAAIQRSTLDGRTESAFHPQVKYVDRSPEHPAYSLFARSSGGLVFHAYGAEPIHTQNIFPEDDRFSARPTLQCPGHVDILGMCVGPSGGVTTLEWQRGPGLHEPVMNHYDRRMSHVASVPLSPDLFANVADPDSFRIPVPMVARGRARYFALGRELHVVAQSGDVETVAFELPILSLAGDKRNLRRPLAIGTVDGTYLLHAIDDGPVAVNTGCQCNSVIWTRGGHLVVVSESRSTAETKIDVFQVDGTKPTPIGGVSSAGEASDHFCVAAQQINQFCIVNAAGSVRLVSIR